MADNFKVMSVKFLMNMFEGMYNVPNGVKLFKGNVNNLVTQGQVAPVVRDLVFSLYGIKESDTFYQTRVQNKLMQVKFLMNMLEGMSQMPNGLSMFTQELNKQVQSGQVLDSARDMIYAIYDLPLNTSKSTVNQRTKTATQTAVASGSNNKPQMSKTAIQKLLSSIDRDYINIAYYEYIISDDGCSRVVYGHDKVLDTPVPHPNSKIVYKIKEADPGDGCSGSGHPAIYSETPPRPKAAPVSSSSYVAATVDGCTSSMGRGHC